MKQDVRLYIADRLVDFSNELSLPFTYQLEDLKNPTIIKNSFTKTITIVGTKNNNQIFGEIYNLDRGQLYDENYIVGAYFNPSFRTPFQLFNNGEIIETGYMQLNTVTIKNKLINYNITLYGGLGDFFYNLSYNEQNEPLQLKDLDYGEDLSFIMDKKVVMDAWEDLNVYSDSTKPINFIPSYNGLYENFDNNKVLINTRDSEIFPYSSTTVDNVTYTPYNGYALGALNNDYTEWEMRSLMSYKQRPALKLSKFIEACCNPQNNGGYEIELDDDFFNPSNPYYSKAYIALPLLESKVDGSAESIEDNVTIDSTPWVGIKDNVKDLSTHTDIMVVGSNIPMDENGIIDTTGMNNSTFFDIDLDVQLFFKQQGNSTYRGDLYNSTLGVVLYNWGIDALSSQVLQIEAVNADNNTVVGKSDYYNFTNKLTDKIYSEPSAWKNWSNPSNTPIQNVFGNYVYNSSLGKHYFLSDEGNNTFRIKLEKCKRVDNIRFQLVLKSVYNEYQDGTYMFKQKVYNAFDDLDTIAVGGYWTCAADSATSKMYAASGDVDMASGQKISQDILLKTEKTPCDFLLSYCKLFGLHFKHSITDKKISILLQHNYFTGNIIDITDKIDWSKDVVINPILYDKKFYRLNLEGNDSYVTEKYKNEYGVEYGQKRINTNYNFNSETTDLLTDNVYQNVVSITDNSLYFRTFFNSAGTQQPPFIVDNLTYKTFNTASGDTKENDVEIYGSQNIDLSKTVNWNINAGYDMSDKLCCFTKDEKKSLADLSACLVFYDGFYYPMDLNSNDVRYWLVDDVPEMFFLNEKQCHLYTESPFDRANNWIAYEIKNLPKFSRYMMDENKITDSWDFSKPKEMFIPNISYNENTTIYDQFWSKVYEDKLNINTKRITAYVNLTGFNVNENMLQDFYYFNNCHWLLNKIENYDINNYQTVKCEFIKINDVSNYMARNGKKYDYFYIDTPIKVVDYKMGVYATKIHSTTPWNIGWYNDSKIINLYPTSGDAGVTEITFDYTENTSYEEENFYASFTTSENIVDRISIDFKQTPNPTKAVKLSGKIKWASGALIPNGHVLAIDPTNNAHVYSLAYMDKYTGEYTLYVPKGIQFILEVQTTNSDPIFDQTYLFNEDTTLNLNIFRL